MKKIIALSGSNSKESINKELAVFASSLLDKFKIEVLDLNDFEVPMYGIDEENLNGIPKNAASFLGMLHSADGIIISLAEHNGNFSAVFKNMYDWSSRIESKVWNNIPMLLMATSPGGRGGATVLSIAKNGFPHLGGNIVADFSLPNFYDNFKEGEIVNEELLSQLKDKVTEFEGKVNQE